MEFIKKNPLIICTCGKARSGKSLVGKYIYNEYKKNGLKVIISPYTKYLKQYISDITGNSINDDNKPRVLLQKISSDLIKGKLGNNNFFINRQLEDIDIYSYFFDVIIIPDVRFPEEIEVLRKKYNKVIAIGIKRNNYDNGLTEEEQKDITEISLDDYKNYDYELINNSDAGLYNDTLKIINELRKVDFNE